MREIQIDFDRVYKRMIRNGRIGNVQEPNNCLSALLY